MNRLALQTAFLLHLLACHAGAGVSSWDETQLELLGQYSTPLRWDNVEGTPQWVAGPKPHFQLAQGRHLFRIQPGEEVTLRGAANTWLRLAGERKTLKPGDLDIRISTDARSFVQATPILTVDPYCLLLELPRDKACLIRLALPSLAKSSLVFAAYFSHEELFPTLLPYRETVRLPGKNVRVRRDHEADSRLARLLRPDECLDLTVKGPTRLRLDVLLQWPCTGGEREQPLVLQVGVDDAPSFPLLLSPELDSSARINHERQTVARPLRGFLNVPNGEHRVKLQTLAPIYLSILQRSHQDFLLPWLNAPTPSSQPSSPALRGPAQRNEVGSFSSSVLQTTNLAASEQEAWNLARDNHWQDAGGQAADWLNRISRTRRDHPLGGQAAESLYRQRTTYREVLPSRLPVGQTFRRASFSAEHLLPLFQPEQRTTVLNPTMEQVYESFAQGHFVDIPQGSSPGFLYDLPPRSFDSRIRIAVIRAASTRTGLLIQFDQTNSFRAEIESVTLLPRSDFAPSDSFATLRVLQQTAQFPTNLPLALGIDDFDLPLPLAEPGILELPLPQHVRQVRILPLATDNRSLVTDHSLDRPTSSSTAPPAISVAYRAAKPFAFGQTAYQELLRQVGAGDVLLLLSRPSDKQPFTSEPLRQLENHLLPLARLLKTRHLDFTKGIDLNPLAHRATQLSPPEGLALANSALLLEKERRFLEAAESWNRLFWDGTTNTHVEATLGVMRCLQSLGEEFLAAQYARYALLRSPNTEAPTSAVALLEQQAREADDWDQLEQLRAFLFHNCPCPQHWADVVEALARNGRDELALTAGLILPRGSRPAELLLTAALHLNWWPTFDDWVSELPEAATRSFWRAQKHLAFYQFLEAERELQQSTLQGREMLRAVQEGMRIRAKLADPSLPQRLDAVFAWEEWQLHEPGPKTWEEALDILPEGAASELLFNTEQNQFSSHLRAERDRPVKLRFLGPLRLRVEARPILPLPFVQPAEDWLEVIEYGLTNRIPVSQSVPNPSLQFTASRNCLAGTRAAAQLEFGPGWHEVEVAMADHAALIRVLQERPLLPLRILPALNAARLNRVLRSEDTPHHRLHLALRLESRTELLSAYDPRILPNLTPSEQWLAALRANRMDDFTNWAALPDSAQVRVWLARGQIQTFLNSIVPRDPLQRLSALLEISELFPAWREQAQCLAEFFAQGTNCPPGGKKWVTRLTRDRTWVPLPISPVSAGLRPVQFASDAPQDPSARLRQALLPPAATNQFTLSAHGVFTLSLSLQHPTRVDLGAELARAGFAPLTPLVVSLQVDALPVQHLPLKPASPETGTNLLLAEGSHLVRAWIEDPVVNQLVRLSVSASRKGTNQTVPVPSVAEAATEKRFFHQAVPGRPVRFFWKGPALLRVDEWREGTFFSHLRLVEAGERRIEIPVEPGRAESWYQIAVRTTQTNQPNPRLALAIREPDEIAPPKLTLHETPAPSHVQLTDHYRLGGQEDGTWTFSALAAQRLPFEISSSQRAVENEFVEASVAYRKANAADSLWSGTKALARVHRPGDLTLGLSERLEGHPQSWPFQWSWSAEAFGGTTGPRQQDLQGALYTELEAERRFQLNPKLDFLPFAGLFAHYLTLGPTRASQYDYIDQDLYTSFRNDHRWGAILGGRLEYRPWLDSLLKGALALQSNEDFTPDNAGLRVAWTQLAGPFHGELAYQCRYFLNDTDRSSDSFLQGISAGLMFEHWINGCHRVELGVHYRHDWPHSGNSFVLLLRWDVGAGRRYRDYSPRELVFRDLRSRRFPKAFNNHLEPDPSGAALP